MAAQDNCDSVLSESVLESHLRVTISNPQLADDHNDAYPGTQRSAVANRLLASRPESINLLICASTTYSSFAPGALVFRSQPPAPTLPLDFRFLFEIPT